MYGAVSYTHLDVYKRQVVNCGNTSRRSIRACTGEFALAAVVLSAIHRARFPMELLCDATEWLRRFTSLIKRNARCFGNMSWGNDNALSELWPAPRR